VKKAVKIGLCGMLLVIAGLSGAYASDKGDHFFVDCLLHNTALAPANQRFFCACETAIYQTDEQRLSASFMKRRSQSASLEAKQCLTTINPYYELLHKEKLAAQQSDVSWSWL